MIRDYVSTRPVLSRCCVLVDCTRGFCEQDVSFLKFLRDARVDWQIVLTKCDLLTAEQLAQCIILLEKDLTAMHLLSHSDSHDNGSGKNHFAGGRIRPVSAATGAGVQLLWNDLLTCAVASTSATARSVSPTAVCEHVLAPLLRQRRLDKERGR